jgi:hypothetical protein
MGEIIPDNMPIHAVYTTMSLRTQTKNRVNEVAKNLGSFKDSYDVILNKMCEMCEEQIRQK